MMKKPHNSLCVFFIILQIPIICVEWVFSCTEVTQFIIKNLIVFTAESKEKAFLETTI